jgi:hypothetical protein
MTDQHSRFLVVEGKYLPLDAPYCAGRLAFSHHSGMQPSLEDAIANGVCITIPMPKDTNGARTGVLSQVAEILKADNCYWLKPTADVNDPWEFNCSLFLNEQEAWAKGRPSVSWLTDLRLVEPEVDVAAQVVRFEIPAR